MYYNSETELWVISLQVRHIKREKLYRKHCELSNFRNGLSVSLLVRMCASDSWKKKKKKREEFQMTGVLIHFSNSCKNDKRNSNLFFNNKQCKNEIQIHFSKLSENEKQNAKFKSVFQCHAKTKNVNGIWIPFSHAIEKRLALRYTHLLASRTWNFTRKPRKQKYEIRSISEYYVTITRPAVWKRNTPHAVSNTNKGKKVKFIEQISFAEKN